MWISYKISYSTISQYHRIAIIPDPRSNDYTMGAIFPAQWTPASYGASVCNDCGLNWSPGWNIAISNIGSWTVRTAAATDLEGGIQKGISQHPALHIHWNSILFSSILQSSRISYKMQRDIKKQTHENMYLFTSHIDDCPIL